MPAAGRVPPGLTGSVHEGTVSWELFMILQNFSELINTSRSLEPVLPGARKQNGGQGARTEEAPGDSGIVLPVDYSSSSDEDPAGDVSVGSQLSHLLLRSCLKSSSTGLEVEL